jgi:hypothetical protein
MNKELEEASVRKYGTSIYEYEQIDAFIEGANWQEKRMYSEKDMREAITFGLGGMYGYQWGKEGETDTQIDRYLEELKKK